MQLLNHNVLLLYIKRLLQLDQKNTPFRILALEESFYDNVAFEASGNEYNPILKLKEKGDGSTKKRGYKPVGDIKDVYGDFADRLTTLLTEIFDESVPFSPTQFVDRCEHCPYKDICGLTV